MASTVLVQVVAVGGKFVGDDIGGAAITIRDADTNEILAQGVTKGDSGPNGLGGVMDARIRPGEIIPIGVKKTASAFSKDLAITSPQRIHVSAYGPLGARGSANTASTTTWLYPGKPITANNGILLELPGLICQVINPPTHTANLKAPATVQIVTNIAMMCGCPISWKVKDAIVPGDPDDQPWLPGDFTVEATLMPMVNGGDTITKSLHYDIGNVPGRFVGTLKDLPADTYQMTVFAQQISTGNTGGALSTFVVAAAS